MTTPQAPAELLREGRNLLFEQGWGQTALVNSNGNLCMVGALRMASPAWVSPDLMAYVPTAVKAAKVYDLALDHLRDAVLDKRLPVWNDIPGRTFDQVVAAYDRAEKLAERSAQ